MIKRKFTSEEDSKICEIVNQKGARNWDLIAKEIPGRTGRQIRDRYQNYLFPGFFNGQWTAEEDELLYKKICELGFQWANLKKFFPGRSANGIRNRWNCFVCKFQSEKIKSVNQFEIINNLSPFQYINQFNKQADIRNNNLRTDFMPNLNFQGKTNFKVNKETQTKDSSFLCASSI